MSAGSTPLSQRKRDWFFVVALGALTLGSLTSDVPRALGFTAGAGGINDGYVRLTGDHFFASDPMPLRVRISLSAFVFCPLTAYLTWAFVRGAARARPIALLYGGAMIASMIEFIAWEWSCGTPPERPAAFFLINGPYLLVALLLVARMWGPRPFGLEA